MSQRIPRNVSASVRQRLLDLSRNSGEDYHLTLIRFATERLLYRLSVSPYANQFVLKGAALFAVWSETPYRATRDVDLLAYGDSDIEAIHSIFEEVLNQAVQDDGLNFNESSIRINEIRDQGEYAGLRLRMTAYLERAEIPVQIDLGFGDVVVPSPLIIKYTTILDFPAPKLRAYSPESVVAEKVQAAVTLGMVNSRLKDYCDLYMILHRFSWNEALLEDAICATFERRKTEIPHETPIGFSAEFSMDETKQKQWARFLSRNRLDAAPEEFSITVEAIWEKLKPIFDRVGADKKSN